MKDLEHPQRREQWLTHYPEHTFPSCFFNPLNAELNPICHLLALLGAHPILHVSRIRVNIHLNTFLPSISMSCNPCLFFTSLKVRVHKMWGISWHVHLCGISFLKWTVFHGVFYTSCMMFAFLDPNYLPLSFVLYQWQILILGSDLKENHNIILCTLPVGWPSDQDSLPSILSIEVNLTL
jgi:hypothetical protein